jgi:hypothetical protein
MFDCRRVAFSTSAVVNPQKPIYFGESGQEMVSFPYRAFEFYPFEHPQ